jgi:hypothetical protein
MKAMGGRNTQDWGTQALLPPHPKPHLFGGFSYYIWRAPYFMNISLRKEKRSYTYYLRVG